MQDQKEQHFHDQILQHMPMAYACHKILWDFQGRPEDWEFVEVNSAFEKVVERSAEDLKGQRGSRVFRDRPEAFARWLEEGGAVARHGGVREGEHYSETLQKWYSYRFYAPQKEYFALFLWDITEEKQKLRQRETLLMFLHHAVFTLDENYVFVEVLPGCEADLFVPPEKCLGKSMYDLLPLELCVQFEAAFQEAREKGKSFLSYASPFEEDPRFFEGEIHYVRDIRRSYFVISVQDVTLRTKQDHALRESQERWKAYVENAPYGVFVTDMEGRYVEVNPEASRITGYSRQELLIRRVGDLIPAEGKPLGVEHFEGLKQNGRSHGEIPFCTKEGESRWWSVYARKISENRCIGFCEDITEKRELRCALERERAFLRKVIDTIPAFVCVKNAEGRFSLANEALSNAYGSSVAKIEGHADEEHSPTPEEVQSFLQDDLQVIRQRKSLKIPEERITYADGSMHWHKTLKVPLIEEDGSCSSLLAVSLDITERKKMEDELERERERLELALHAASAGLWDWNLALGEVYFGPRYYTMAGYEPDAFPRCFEEWQKRVHPEDLSRCLKTVEAVCASERLQGFDMDFRFLRKDGEWMWIRGYGKVVARSPEGKAERIVGFHLDCTERKEMEELLFEEKERFRTTLLSIGDGIMATNSHGNVILMNHVAERLTGYTVEEARGRPLREIFRVEHEETGEAVRDLADRVLASGEVVHLGNHVVLLGREGSRTPLEDSAAPIRNTRGEITGVVVVCSDMTEKKKRQQEILYLSTHDHLTGLWNRRSMEETLQKLDMPEQLPLGIVVADVNGLKLINDAFGYPMGDMVLQKAGDLLCGAAKEEGGIVGRLGGDEFGILLPRKNSREVAAFIEKVTHQVASVDLGSVVFSLALGYAVKIREDESIEKVRMQAENALHQNTLRHAKEVRSETVERVLMHLNMRYDREQMHTEGVAAYAEALARALEYHEHQIEIVRAAAVLHDIGKIMVPPEILNKVEPLTDEEFAVIRKHPETGYQILRSVEEYAGLAEYVLYHHERWDGKGYPQGLRGEAIPLVSRIITVADAYEAMTAQRPYQTRKTPQEAAEEIRRCAGTQFDPCLARVFLELVL